LWLEGQAVTDAFNPNDHFQQLPSEKYADLPKETRDFLDELRPEEVDVIRQIARLGPEGSQQLIQAIKLSQSVMTVGKFVRWVIITMLGVFFGTLLFAEKIMQVIAWFGHNGSPPR